LEATACRRFSCVSGRRLSAASRNGARYRPISMPTDFVSAADRRCPPPAAAVGGSFERGFARPRYRAAVVYVDTITNVPRCKRCSIYAHRRYGIREFGTRAHNTTGDDNIRGKVFRRIVDRRALPPKATWRRSETPM